MTDRERRLCRALTRLATAHDLCERARHDVGACIPELDPTAGRLAGRVRWLAGRVRRELERAEVPDDRRGGRG